MPKQYYNWINVKHLTRTQYFSNKKSAFVQNSILLSFFSCRQFKHSFQFQFTFFHHFHLKSIEKNYFQPGKTILKLTAFVTKHREMSHTILLVQPGARPETRTYSDYESVNECMEGVCKIYEEHLKRRNPNTPTITYDISQLFDFLDQVNLIGKD